MSQRSEIKIRGNTQLKITGGRGPSGAGGDDTPTFEKVSQNLDSNGATFNYTGEQLTSVVYTDGITKTLAYTGELLTTVTLSGSTPSGIDLIKTLSYTGEQLTGIAYS